jgi:TRAP-type C4-dicarboxylate transport system substrate-binding protein
MQKGMADGTWTGASALQDFKLIEVTKSITVLNSTCPTSVMVMNMKMWNSLPPDVQKVFDELSGVKLSMKQGEGFDIRAREGFDSAKSLGYQIYELTPAEKKAWAEKAKPVCDAWIADMEKKGLPGGKVYQDAVLLLDKYSK